MIICDNEEYKEAADFYAKKLGIPDDTIIAVGLYHDMPVSGYCEYNQEEVLPYFVVAIDLEQEDGCDHPLAILAHEMVHVKQYVKGELVDHGKYCSWHGNKYEEFECDSEDYYFSPWEVEAYGMQVGLYRMYCRSMEE